MKQAGDPTAKAARMKTPAANRTLNARELAILYAVIDRHIATAAPVGSAHVASLPGIDLSPASVRAIMADLTGMGFLSQPHTSAGRVPTARALKLYADRFTGQTPQNRAERDEIQRELSRAEHEIVTLLQYAATLLARRAGQVGVVLAPDRDSARLRSITFVPASSGLVLAVLELEGGLVSTCAVYPAETFSAGELVRFGNFLTNRFAGSSLAGMRAEIHRETGDTGRKLEDICLRALSLSRLALEHIEADRELFVNGAPYLFEQAEFADLSRMRRMLEFIEDRSRLLDLLDATLRSEAVSITLGPEQSPGLEPCAVISAPFGTSGPRGVISLVGPLRMDYARLIPMITNVSGALTTLYTQYLARATA